MVIVIIIGIVASLLAAMKSQKHRFLGFCGFFCTNICWITYGVVHVDYNIILQFGCFLVISSIGLWSNKGFIFESETMAEEFKGNKFVEATELNGSYYSAEYVEWLEQQMAELNCQLEACRKQRASLRKTQEAQRQAAARRFRDQSDYVPYGEDEYDR
jgi:hypothetical protein